MIPRGSLPCTTMQEMWEFLQFMNNVLLTLEMVMWVPIMIEDSHIKLHEHVLALHMGLIKPKITDEGSLIHINLQYIPHLKLIIKEQTIGRFWVYCLRNTDIFLWDGETQSHSLRNTFFKEKNMITRNGPLKHDYGPPHNVTLLFGQDNLHFEYSNITQYDADADYILVELTIEFVDYWSILI